MTRVFTRGDRVTTGGSDRVWTFQHTDGEFASLRDDKGVLCSVPVASLWPVQAAATPSGWPFRIGVSVVIVFAAISAACVYRIVQGRVVLNYVTSAVLLAVASAAVIAWMVALLRGVWRRS